MKQIIILISIILITISSFAQEQHAQYLTVESGLSIDRLNSLGLRTFIEYQKNLKNNWHYGISYDHTERMGYAATDIYPQEKTNFDLLSFNSYYHLNALKNRIFWSAGIGAGIAHIYWNDFREHKFRPTVNASFTLNVRVYKGFYLTSSPLILIIPVNRFYFAPFGSNNFKNYFATTFFPFGIKFKL